MTTTLPQPTIHPLRSGGFLIDLGDGGFPVWRRDMEAVRRFLLERDMDAAEGPRVNGSNPTQGDTVGSLRATLAQAEANDWAGWKDDEESGGEAR